jgi:hypothetical protein
MLSQVAFLWVMPKLILDLSCVRFFYPFHRNDSCGSGSGSGSLRSNVSYARAKVARTLVQFQPMPLFVSVKWLTITFS